MADWWNNPDEVLDVKKVDLNVEDKGEPHRPRRRSPSKVWKTTPVTPTFEVDSQKNFTNLWYSPSDFVRSGSASGMGTVVSPAPMPPERTYNFAGRSSPIVETRRAPEFTGVSTTNTRRRQSTSDANALRQWLSSELENVDAKRVCSLARNILQTLRPGSRSLQDVFTSLASICDDINRGDQKMAILTLCHALLIQLSEPERKAFINEALSGGHSEPWDAIRGREDNDKICSDYATYLKMKTSLMCEVPEFEANYSIQRYEFKVVVEQNDPYRKAIHDKRRAEVISRDACKALRRLENAGLTVAEQIAEKEKDKATEIETLSIILVFVDIVNSIALHKAVQARAQCEAQALASEGTSYTDDKLKALLEFVRTRKLYRAIVRRDLLPAARILQVDNALPLKSANSSADMTPVICTFSGFAHLHKAVAETTRSV